LDKQYGAKPSATTTVDRYLLAFTVAVATLFVWRGVEGVSFIAGLWIGGTLIQLYFHTYHYPVAPDRAAPPQTSPLKQMSYAIQDAPWRAWPQMLAFAALVACGLFALL
jgi:multisubunit Na+/H+ antiporter MnhB subunit